MILSGKEAFISSTAASTTSCTRICDPGGNFLARLATMGFPIAPRPMKPRDWGSVLLSGMVFVRVFSCTQLVTLSLKECRDGTVDTRQ